MEVLITGAGGYIGRASVAAFLQAGWKVRAASRSGNAPGAAVDWRRIDSLESGLDALVSGVDCVVHLAGVAHRPETPAHIYQEVNCDATEALALAARRAGVSRFVFVSSVAVHGPAASTAVLTESTPPAPMDPYGQSKWQAEQRVQRIAEGSAMSWTVIRPPLVHGPAAPGNFGRLARLARSGMPLPLAAATAPRSYVGLTNLVDALVLVASHPRAADRLYLVTDGEDVGTAGLVRLMRGAIGRPARLWKLPLRLLRLGAALVGRAGEAEKLISPYRLDGGLIRSELGWNPPLTLSEGIEQAMRGTIRLAPQPTAGSARA